MSKLNLELVYALAIEGECLLLAKDYNLDKEGTEYLDDNWIEYPCYEQDPMDRFEDSFGESLMVHGDVLWYKSKEEAEASRVCIQKAVDTLDGALQFDLMVVPLYYKPTPTFYVKNEK